MTDRDENQTQQEEEPFPDFDTIEILISIDDPLVIGEELHHRTLITEAEWERSGVDIVEHYLTRGVEEMLEEYQRRREGDERNPKGPAYKTIEIDITIDDGIETQREYLGMARITEEKLDLLEDDIVERETRLALDSALTSFESGRD